MEYSKRIIIGILLIVMSSLPVYGTEIMPSNDLNEYIEIINPSIEEDNNIEVQKNFFVSFNIKEKANLYLTIKKIIPVMDEIFLDRISSDEMEQETFINSLTLRVLEIQGYIEYDNMPEQEATDYETKKNEIKAIISRYVEDYLIEQESYKEYISIQKEIEVLKNNTETKDALVVLPESYESIRSSYHEKRRILEDSKEAYDDLFKVSILNKDPIQPEGVMPYYEKTIEDIKYGSYEMVVELKNEDTYVILENFDLSIGPRDEVAEDELIEKEIKLIQPMNLDELEE